MKKRLQVTVGVETQKLIRDIAARFRKETNQEFSQSDVVESAAAHGLRHIAEKFKLDRKPLATLRD